MAFFPRSWPFFVDVITAYLRLDLTGISPSPLPFQSTHGVFGKMENPTSQNSHTNWSPQKRSFVSLLIIVHLVVVAVVFSCNYYASDLQGRLSRFFAIYAQSLNLDPLGTKYYLTQATDIDDDQFVEVHLEGRKPEEVIRYPADNASPFSANAKRERQLASLLSYFATQDDSETSALVAKAIGGHAMHKYGAERGELRSYRHSGKFMNSTDDVWSRNYFAVNYEADFWLHNEKTEVLKRSAAREVAPTE